MARAEFSRIKAGDLIIFPPQGPGRVISLDAEAGKAILVFPSGQQLELSTGDIEQDGRLPVTRERALEARAILQDPDIQADPAPFAAGFAERMQVVSSGDLLRMALLLRKLAARSDPPSPGELAFRQNLEAQVLTELAAVLGLSLPLLAGELKQAAANPSARSEREPPADPPKETPKVACYRHPETAASDTCPGCLRPMCDVCAMPNAAGFLCPECNRRRERRGLLLKVAGFFLVSGLLLGGGIFLLDHYEPAFDYGPKEAKIHRLSKRLAQDPCDRVKMLSLGELLLEAGDHPRVIADCRRFLSECGEFNRLLWLTYEANKRMGQYDEAIADVNRLIAAHPFDKDFRWWRAEAHARKRDWERALADYRQALGLQPRLRSIPYEMLRAAKEAGKPCEGIMAIEQLVYHHPALAEDANLLHQLESLYRLPDCRGMAGAGHAALPLSPVEAGLPVELPGGKRGRFQIDLQSAYSLLSEKAAEAAEAATSAEFFLWDGRKVRKGRWLKLASLRVDEARAEAVEALVVDDLPEGVDGLLGLSFLSRFALRLDPASNTLELSPKLND